MLFFIRINNYETLAMDIGVSGLDLVLSDISIMLQENIPEEAVLSHFSDDVFTILLVEDNPDIAVKYGQKICALVEEHLLEIDGKTIRLSTRIGIAPINDSSANAQAMIIRAHSASDKVKDETEYGTGAHLYTYIEELEDSGEPQSIIQLQKAIEGGMFKILFQPIICLRGNNQPFYEVLLRMLNENGEQISPHEFLQTAVAHRLSEKIDRWVIIQSIKSLADQYAEGFKARIIINLTPQTLMDETFISWLSMALKASRLPHDALVFQLTESDANMHLKQAKIATKALSELHCKTALSRFGCSTNPFSILKHLTVDYLKIDGSYTKDLSEAESQQSLKDVIDTAHQHGKLTIASFVEDSAVLSSLYTVGINYIQGYYLQPPSEVMDYDFSME